MARHADVLDGSAAARANHLTWVRTRMALDAEFLESARHGFSLIAAGFGSFSLFEGLTLGEHNGSALPRTFALIVTAVGIGVILLAMAHDRTMTAWVDADAFDAEPVPELPDERRPFALASAAVVIGVISFVALLRLP